MNIGDIEKALQGADRMEDFEATGQSSWTVGDYRTVSIGGEEFWLALCQRKKI